ncbi:MAG: hypothetical protein HY664_02225 [Chloroflexi bacterium]|nr:hypothetical protein [Chloroflexota bacterium]
MILSKNKWLFIGALAIGAILILAVGVGTVRLQIPRQKGLTPRLYIPYISLTKATPTAAPQVTPQTMPEVSPLPTATPTPNPCPVEKTTKLGIGVYNRGGGHILSPILQAKPGVIFLMDPDPGFARDVRRCFPKAFIVGRRFMSSQPLDNPQLRGEQVADYVAELAVPLKGVINAWVSYNEVVGSSDFAAYQAYNTFQVVFAQKLQGVYGVDAVAGNDGVGVVAPDDYAKYFAEAIAASKYFGVHAYAPQGANTMRQDAEHYVLRYRAIYNSLYRAGIQHGPFILTESGLWNGWRGVTSENSMAKDFLWLADETEKDDYVIGQAIFGLFANKEWQDFDVADSSAILDALGGYLPRRSP